MSEEVQTLPRWDMDVYFPGLETDAFEQEFEAVRSAIGELAELFDEHGIQARAGGEVDEGLFERFENVLQRYNELQQQVRLVHNYIVSFVTTDSKNETAQARQSELRQELVTLSMLDTRLIGWLGSLDVEALIDSSEVAREHAFTLRQAKREAEHLMSPEKEELAARLEPSGSSAWGKLHGDLSSQITVELEVEGERRELPMSAVRNMAYEPDRDLRRRAYQAELASWERWQVPLAAALNSIKGEVNTLSQERGWDSPLAVSLFQSNIDRETLDAMLQAGRESFPDFRRYLKAKAQALGVDRLAWFDIFAPMEQGAREWSYPQAEDFILEQFGGFSDRLRGLAERAFEERWIDAEPRAGKRDGAFCMYIQRDESRILANFQASYDGMSTLAHELGHAYHNLNLAERTPLQRDTPMTLAETASTFCQTIIQKKAFEQADEAGKLYILEAAIQDACQVVVDISSRFQFEQAVFDQREQRELSPQEFCDLMLQAQADTYGQGLDADQRHPYMWAVKPHYYSGGLSFYNYPYMFGLLFGLGLFARYQQDPDEFRASYDDLLSSTGMANAAELANRFDIDIRTPDFWRASLDVVREDIDRFVALVEAG